MPYLGKLILGLAAVGVCGNIGMMSGGAVAEAVPEPPTVDGEASVGIWFGTSTGSCPMPPIILSKQTADEFSGLAQEPAQSEGGILVPGVEMPNPSFNRSFSGLYALVGLAEYYRTENQNEQTHSVLNAVLQNINALARPYLKVIVLAGVAGVLASLNENDRAQEVLSQAQEFAAAAENTDQRNISTVALIEAYRILGKYEKALQVAETIDPPDLREQIQEAISCAAVNPSR